MKQTYLLIILSLALVACGRPEPAESTPEAAKTKAEPQGAVPSKPKVTPEDKALMELKAAARTLLAADKTAVSNKISFQQASERYRRDMEGTGMNRRIPAEAVTLESLRSQLSAHGKKHGDLQVDKVLVSAPQDAKPVPATHDTGGPYPYEIDQILARVPISVTVNTVDKERLKVFYRNLPGSVDSMLDLPVVRLEGSHATFTGHLYHQRVVTPPIQVTKTPSVDELARQAKVSVPRGHPRLGEVEALLAKHAQLHEDLSHSMKALGDAHLLGSRFRFYRERAKAIELRAFPSVVDNDVHKAPHPTPKETE